MRLKCKVWFIIPFVAILLMSHNASALDVSVPVTFNKGYFYPYWSDSNNRTYATGGYKYITNGNYASATAVYFKTSSNTNLSASKGQYVSLSGSITLSVTSNSQIVSIQANPRQYFSMSSTSTDCPLLDISDQALEQYQTGSNTWLLRYNFTSVCRLTSNVSSNIAMNWNLNGNSTSGTDYLNFTPQYIAVWTPQEGFDDTAILNAISNLTSKIQDLGDKLDDAVDALQEQNEKEQEASDNIENQDYHDLQGDTDNSQTTSLIGSLSGFLSAITNLSATNCNVTLQFPQFAGGNMTVNVCQNKQYTGNIVSVAGSILLVLFYLPLAFVMVNMIYREIRSFTNG